MVDLASPDWPLVPLTWSHHSNVTCVHSVGEVSQNVWIKLDFLRRKNQGDAGNVANVSGWWWLHRW